VVSSTTLSSNILSNEKKKSNIKQNVLYLKQTAMDAAQSIDTNSTSIRNIATEGGIFFVIALDSIIFLFGLLLFLLCWRRTALYQSSSSIKDVEPLLDVVNDVIVDEEDEKNDFGVQWEKKSKFRSCMDRLIQWLFYTRKYEIFASKYGHEVAVYLYFSKQVILALGLCAFLGLTILLPIHLTGTAPKTKLEEYQYGNWKLSRNDYFLLTTTISMVNNNPGKLYAHVVMTIVFVIIILAFLHRFNSSPFTQHYVHPPKKNRLLKEQVANIMISDYSVQISGLPKTLVDNNILKKVVEDIYPGQIFSARIVLDMRKRLILQEKLDYAIEMLEHYTFLTEQRRKHSPTLVLCCGQPAIAGCCGLGADAVGYWEAKRERYQQKIAQWENNFRNNPKSTGYAHLIFKTITAAMDCRSAAENGNNLIRTKTIDFKVERASEPDDLKWKNFSYGFGQRSARTIVVHIVLFFFLIFFTTPLSIVSSIQDFISHVPIFAMSATKIEHLTGYLGDLVFQYLPTFLLFILTLLIPTFIPILTEMEGYRTYSRELLVKLFRLFIYLLLSTFILPSLLLTSLDGIIKYLQKDNVYAALQNIFLPSSGAFFLNYAIQYFLLGDFIDLLRLRDFFTYLYRKWTAVTPKERLNALKVGDFDLAMEYAYLISFFAIIVGYSVFSPFMLLVGFLYFLSKYLIDRHNITRLCNKNDRAQFKLTRDTYSYRQKTRLITHLVMLNVLVFECMMLLFFAKGGRQLYPHLIIMLTFLPCTFIYCVYWTLTFDNSYTDAIQEEDTPLIQEEDGRREHEISMLLNYCSTFKDVYFNPYSLKLLPNSEKQLDEELRSLYSEQQGIDHQEPTKTEQDIHVNHIEQYEDEIAEQLGDNAV
jgi:hypothetical protein